MVLLQVLNPVEETPMVIVVEEQVLGKIVDEPLVLDEQLVQSMIANELVLHIVVVVEEMCRIVNEIFISSWLVDASEVGVPGTSTVPYLNGPLSIESRRSYTTTRHKGKEIVKPITPPSETTSEEDSDLEQAQRDKDMQKNLALIAKYFKKSTNLPTITSELPQTQGTRMWIRLYSTRMTISLDCLGIKGWNLVISPRNAEIQKGLTASAYHKEKMLLCKQAEQYDWLADTDEEVQNFAGYNVFVNDLQHSEKYESNGQNDVESDDERVVLANLKLDVNENKKILKQLKKANTTHAQELKECKAILAKTTKSLGESISSRDSCLVALQTKQTEFEKYKAFNDRTIDYDKLERKLNETLGQLAQKDIKIKEGLKTKAYELSVVNEKHDELIKQSLLTKSHYEGLVKQKTKVITDLKLSEEHDNDKMLSMEKQLKFLNEIVYKRIQSIQTIYIMAPKEFEIQLAYANEIRKKMWRKSFVKSKPNIYKNVGFLLVLKSISKSRQAYNVMTNNLNHFKEIVDKVWIKHLIDQFRAPTAQDMEILIQTCLMPLAIKTQNDSFLFVHELKQEMHADLKYVESLEKEIDELESDKAKFSNMYDVILQECISKDVMCSYLLSLSDLDALDELQCLYLQKVKECDQKHSISLEIALQKRKEQVKHDTVWNEKASNVFRKERKQYLENQDLKAQLQDKNIAIICANSWIWRFGSRKCYDKQGLLRQRLCCDADLEVAFRKSICFVRDLQVNDLLISSNSQDKQPKTNIQPTSVPSTPTYVHVEENINDQAEQEHLSNDEFTNRLCASAQDVSESSSHNIGNLNAPTLNQLQVSEYLWTKDHPLEQVRENSLKPVQTRRQLVTDPEMYMYALTVSTAEPKNIKEAMANSVWIEAMQEELHQFNRLQVWELVEKPFGKMVLRLKWLWKNKKDEDQTVIRNKARLVAKGTQVFSNLSDGRENDISQWSTKGVVYVAQPDGFVDPDHPKKLYRLRKSLYGLKQAPRAWYDELSKFPTSKGFTKGTIDPTLFTIRYGEEILLAKYTLKILHKHGMENGQSIATPMAMKPKLDADWSGNPVDQTDYHSKIRSLMYLTSSRPDIVQAVCFCARYQSRPTEKHLKEVKRIFRYLRGTVNMGRWYPNGSSFDLTAFSNVDHARCIDSRKSTSGGIQFLGDKIVSWMSKKQNYTTMSSTESEYVELSSSCAQVMWMRIKLQDYGFNYNKIPLYCDSQSAIEISCNPVQYSRMKNNHTRYHFIKEQVENGIIELYFVRTEYQLADMFTKALPEDRFKYLVRRIGMRCLTPAELEVLVKEAA
uniref:Reverse transcriptase Ty1/copia-type domain-containing protein n=1 Tax=Tanacetum cinerariifolium TaxID=118510 RepID=A0A6L2NM21_TANCI|nr:hypothetical protein [Tanacetum cinerariifolium]